MTSFLFLAWRHLLHHRIRSSVLVLVLTIVISIPTLSNRLIAQAERTLTARAEATPLVYGAQGSEIDLVLSSAYFSGVVKTPITMGDYASLIDRRNLGLAPMRLAGTARGYPVVGTDFDYFRLRGLRPVQGEFPLHIGEVVLGSDVAAALNLGPGDVIRTDAEQLFDLASAYPVTLDITGVLAQTGTPDDRAVIGDLRTAWIAEGYGHGHQELDRDRDRRLLLSSQGEGLVANTALPTYSSVTDENRLAFHYHGNENDLPLTAVLVFPKSAKAKALFKGRVADAGQARHAVDVPEAVDALLHRVFRVQTVLQSVTAAMGGAVLAAMALVVALSVRMRRREFEIANQIGAPRHVPALLVTTELAMIAAIAAVLAAGLAGLLHLLDPSLVQGWILGGT